MQAIFSQISLSDILELPATVSIPGLLVIALFIASAIRSFFRLRLIRAFTSIITAAVIALILSKFGFSAATMRKIDAEHITKQSSIQQPLDDRHQRLAKLDGFGRIQVNSVKT